MADDAAELEIDVANCRAVHFFNRIENGLSVSYSREEIILSPSPSKLIPKKVPQNDGSERFETSVILHRGHEDIPWETSKKLYRGKFAFGGIDFASSALKSAGLRLEKSKSKISPEHANLIGWDDDEDVQQAQAMILVNNSTFFVHPASECKLLEYKEQMLREKEACIIARPK